MALPNWGPISMSQINTELGRSASATISLDAAENGDYGAIKQCSPPHPSSGNPASMSEWFGYNHSVTCTVSCGGGFNSYTTDTQCSDYYYREVLLGSYASGTVNVGWTLGLASGWAYNSLRVYVVYNGSTVADTGTVSVDTSTTYRSGTLTFTATGAADRYYVYFIDPYCY